MSVVKVSIKKNWDGIISKELNLGLLEMSTDIHRRSAILAPVDTRALVNSGRIEPIQDGYAIRYGSSAVPYARIQHEGGIIRPKVAKMLAWQQNGEWIFARSVTIKGTKYLAKAGDAVVRGNIKKYWKEI